MPQAQQAGEQLGVDPSNLIAQAALETNWGRSLPQDGSGHSSNNLFGVKATGGWQGPSVQAQTTEVSSQGTTTGMAPFRSYADASQSFRDYVSILRSNPRYAAALNTGSDAHAFATGLQRGGYATDPDYARKVSAIANNISGHLAMTLAWPHSPQVRRRSADNCDHEHAVRVDCKWLMYSSTASPACSRSRRR